MTPARSDMRSAKPASVITLLAGVWLFVSPWVYGASTQNAWNNWIVGALLFIFALIRLNSTNSAGMSWINTALGAWVFASPWIYGYTGNTGRFINSLCVGVIVFFASIISANVMTHGTPHAPQQHV
ncbi:MAG TPA: SPW repeat protein [Bryobacteraceae bacterium]|nr:SPW repeat protein [Bryobacteraceae bacterium]